jgi:hypothetical protein
MPQCTKSKAQCSLKYKIYHAQHIQCTKSKYKKSSAHEWNYYLKTTSVHIMPFCSFALIYTRLQSFVVLIYIFSKILPW